MIDSFIHLWENVCQIPKKPMAFYVSFLKKKKKSLVQLAAQTQELFLQTVTITH